MQRRAGSGILLLFLLTVVPPGAVRSTQLPLGLGMVQPHTTPEKVLYFYLAPPFGKLPDEVAPDDSLTFSKSGNHTYIATAPPWFVPEVMKLDYDVLYLRAVTLSQNWIEVIVNRETGLTRWVDRQAVVFIDWPAFLLGLYAVEILDTGTNPLRVKPLDHASLANPPLRAPLGPIAIQGDWMMVISRETPEAEQRTGWIRWRDASKLLVRLVPLS